MDHEHGGDGAAERGIGDPIDVSLHQRRCVGQVPVECAVQRWVVE